MICLCEWMTHLEQSKWGSLICCFEVPHNDWRQPPKGEPSQGFIPTCQCHETSSIPVKGAARNGQNMWTELSFLSQTFQSLWPFHNSLGIRTTNLICRITDFQGICDLYCYCVLLLRSQTWILVVKKGLALPGVESSKARWKSSSKSISQVKGYSDRKYSMLLPLES